MVVKAQQKNGLEPVCPPLLLAQYITLGPPYNALFSLLSQLQKRSEDIIWNSIGHPHLDY